MSEYTYIKTPKGRIVGGSLSSAQTKGHGGVLLENPKWVVMLALPKTDPATQGIIDTIKAAGAAGFSSKKHLLDRADFAWKCIDGDSPATNQNGVAHNSREGFPGHYVLTFTTNEPPDVVDTDPNVMKPAAAVSCGDWIRVVGSVKPNGSDSNPGVYLNFDGAQFLNTDVAIKTGGKISAREAFGGSPTPTPTPTPAAPPTPTPTPAHDIVAAAVGAPPPPPPAAPTPPTPGLVLTAKGVEAKCDPAAWLANGWTEDSLRREGVVQ